MKVVAIVEGDGEVAALPVLLRRLAAWRTPNIWADVLPPIRVRRERFLHRNDEFERFLALAASKCETDGWILILLDSDDDCPATLARQVHARAAQHIGHRRYAVVLANREYEAWFIAAAQSLDGQRGFTSMPGDVSVDAERPRNAKGWVEARLGGRSYGETTDQPAFSALMNLDEAYVGSRSFRKLCAEWDRQVRASAGVDGQTAQRT